MNRFIYLTVLYLPFIVLGALYPKSFSTQILPYLVIFFIPIITIIRMKFFKCSWNNIFKSFIPFYGLKYRFKVFKEK